METTEKSYQSPSFVYSSHTPTSEEMKKWTFKEKILFTLLGVVVIGGTVFIGRKVLLNTVSKQEEKKSFDEGSSATYAKQLKMAFENDGWPGTDEEAVRSVLREIPSREEFTKVSKSYLKLYNSSLIKDLSDELTSSEYNEMMQIIGTKPLKKGGAVAPSLYASWAKRLKAAFDTFYGFFGGTDSNAIVAVFNEIPSQSDFVKVATHYKTLYNRNLLEDLKSESEFGQYSDWMAIITTKKK